MKQTKIEHVTEQKRGKEVEHPPLSGITPKEKDLQGTAHPYPCSEPAPCPCSEPHLKWQRGAPGWRSRLSAQLQPGHDPVVHEFEPHVRLWADSLEPVSDSVSPSLSAPPPFMLSLSLKNKQKGRLGGAVG